LLRELIWLQFFIELRTLKPNKNKRQAIPASLAAIEFTMKYILHFFLLFFTHTISAQDLSDFNFFFKFGFGGKLKPTTYNSKTDSLTVYGLDTVMYIPLKLTSEEKKAIFNKLTEVNFLKYPEKYVYQYSDSEHTVSSPPCQKYSLTLFNDKDSKSVEWNNCIQSINQDTKHSNLMQLDRLIEKIIWDKKPLRDYHPKEMLIDPN
jgi:hypothetical protein